MKDTELAVHSTLIDIANAEGFSTSEGLWEIFEPS